MELIGGQRGAIHYPWVGGEDGSVLSWGVQKLVLKKTK